MEWDDFKLSWRRDTCRLRELSFPSYTELSFVWASCLSWKHFVYLVNSLFVCFCFRLLFCCVLNKTA